MKNLGKFAKILGTNFNVSRSVLDFQTSSILAFGTLPRSLM